MSDANEQAEAEAAWARYAAVRNKATFSLICLMAILIVPAWSALDFSLEPHVAPRFLVARLVDMVATVVLWFAVRRSESLARIQVGIVALILVIGLTVVWFLPQLEGYYALYTFGFSLVFWGTGLILSAPLAVPVYSFGIILSADLVVYALYGGVGRGEFIGQFLYLGSAALIAATQIGVRRKLEHETFMARFALERRNEALGATQARLYGSSAALAESLDADAIAAHVVEIAVPAIASWATVVATGPGGRRVGAAAHEDPARAHALEEAAQRDRGAPWPSSRATETLVRVTPAELARHAGEHVAKLVTASSIIVAPLVARGERSGTLVLGWADRAPDANELAFVDEVARRAAQALDNARLFREAEAAIKLRDDFISVASHELRTPLSALSLAVEAQALAIPASDPHHAGLVKLDRLVERMSELVAHLLDVNQLAAGRLELALAEMDLAELAREVVDAHREAAARAGSTLTLDVAGPVIGRWDRARLERVIVNLVTNALKYGRGKPVRVRVRGDQARAQLEVTDEGLGIAPADQQRIFERFERVASGPSATGFGLGLWIARTIVEGLGGTIRVSSALDEGTTFTVELPQGQGSVSAPGAGTVGTPSRK